MPAQDAEGTTGKIRRSVVSCPSPDRWGDHWIVIVDHVTLPLISSSECSVVGQAKCLAPLTVLLIYVTGDGFLKTLYTTFSHSC